MANQKRKTKNEDTSEEKPKSFFEKFMNSVMNLKTNDDDDHKFDEYRRKVKENLDAQKEKKEKRRNRREKQKAREREKMMAGLVGKSVNQRSKSIILPTSNLNISDSYDIGGLSLHSQSSNTNSNASSPYVNLEVKQGQEKSDSLRYLNISGNKVLAPSHFSAKNTNKELIKKYKEKRKRKISQLYTGDVYHHALTHIWDHIEDHSKFYDQLDEEIRKKFPITPKIQAKIDKIIKKRDDKAMKELKNKDKCLFLKKVRKIFVRAIQRTNLGYVFKVTPRYYKMTPVIPVYCRRCRNVLENTLEARWTPIGITFAIMFPIVGILCCISYREFVCVVCDEIYVYGDYPSRCKPLDKAKLGSDINVRIKKRSFKRTST